MVRLESTACLSFVFLLKFDKKTVEFINFGLYVLSSFSLLQVISIGLLGFYFYAAVHMKHLADHMSVVSRSAFIF